MLRFIAILFFNFLFIQWVEAVEDKEDTAEVSYYRCQEEIKDGRNLLVCTSPTQTTPMDKNAVYYARVVHGSDFMLNHGAYEEKSGGDSVKEEDEYTQAVFFDFDEKECLECLEDFERNEDVRSFSVQVNLNKSRDCLVGPDTQSLRVDLLPAVEPDCQELYDALEAILSSSSLIEACDLFKTFLDGGTQNVPSLESDDIIKIFEFKKFLLHREFFEIDKAKDLIIWIQYILANQHQFKFKFLYGWLQYSIDELNRGEDVPGHKMATIQSIEDELANLVNDQNLPVVKVAAMEIDKQQDHQIPDEQLLASEQEAHSRERQHEGSVLHRIKIEHQYTVEDRKKTDDVKKTTTQPQSRKSRKLVTEDLDTCSKRVCKKGVEKCPGFSRQWSSSSGSGYGSGYGSGSGSGYGSGSGSGSGSDVERHQGHDSKFEKARWVQGMATHHPEQREASCVKERSSHNKLEKLRRDVLKGHYSKLRMAHNNYLDSNDNDARLKPKESVHLGEEAKKRLILESAIKLIREQMVETVQCSHAFQPARSLCRMEHSRQNSVYATTDSKREHHNSLERNRRAELNRMLLDLKAAYNDYVTDQDSNGYLKSKNIVHLGEKTPKWKVIESATALINEITVN